MRRPYSDARRDEELHHGPARSEDLARNLRQPEALRHLAGAGVLRARGAVDQQNTVGAGGILVLLLGGCYGLARGDPVDRQLIIGIGVFRPRLSRVRALARILVGVPGGVGDLVELDAENVESGIGELGSKTPLELGFVQSWTGHPFARFRNPCHSSNQSKIATRSHPPE